MRGKQPFETVVSRHGATVLRVCRALLGAVDADDAWSDTFLSALQAYPELAEDANVEAWLVTIAHRKAVDLLRRSNRRTEFSGPDITVDGPLSPTTDDVAGPTSRDLDLVRSLAALPEKQRFAVVYHYLVGLPYREVAAIIGGSAEAARRAASDGVAKLRTAKGAAE
ncbi:MAG TPA: RNA polymerase sigma factor [Acidimicrobiales bacterium]|nr:RNA polymerase sigma factor [Acidimicrobiales bacterium]